MDLKIISFAVPETGNFFANVIKWLCNVSSSIVVGIVLFTLILKLITLPFDFFSRASMRKNSLKMEEMRPDLEKLQKQYANDKALYNQKMMALYKKNGYSMFGSCLPTILTLVIFIIALNGFTKFSQYQNRQYFYEMSNAFNNVVYAGVAVDENDEPLVYRTQTGKVMVEEDKIWEEYLDDATSKVKLFENQTFGNVYAEKFESGTYYYFAISSEKGYIDYIRYYTLDNGTIDFKSEEFKVNTEVLLQYNENSIINEKENNKLINSKNEDFKSYLSRINTENPSITTEQAGYDFVLDIRQIMSAKEYRSTDKSFLWVKNVWVTDSPMAHPIESSWAKFRDTHAYPTTGAGNVTNETYKLLIGHLDYEKTAPNGYFILVVLTAGISLLMQVVMSKSQKAQMELQTVDGQGAQTQKMMTIMMPIMMAIFAFMYTSAFSIYIILSNIMSMLTTFGINKIVDTKYKKEQANKTTDANKIRGRVHVEKEEPKKVPEKKNKKVEQEQDGFLSGKADKNKHIRGRIK